LRTASSGWNGCSGDEQNGKIQYIEGNVLLRAYPVAAVGIGVTLLARLALWPLFGGERPYITFLPAVIVAAWAGGRGSGLLATGLGALSAILIVVFTGGMSAARLVPLLLYVTVGVGFSLWLAGLREQKLRTAAAQAALSETEDRFKLAADAARLGVWSRDLRTEKVTWSMELAQIFGIEPEEFGGAEADFFRFVHPEDLPGIVSVIREATEQRRDYEIEFRFIRPDGAIRWMLARGKVYCDAGGTPVRLAGIGLDITDRKLSEEALRTSEERYRSLTAASTSLLFTTDESGLFVSDQKAWREFSGMNDASWTVALHPDDREAVAGEWQRSIASREPLEAEGRLWHEPTNQYRYCALRIVPVGRRENVREWIGAVIDIDERKRLSEKLLQADKLESLGVLAGGIAHDFNNLLVGIMGNASLLADTAQPGSRNEDLARTIVQASERAALLTQQMLAYAGRGQFVVRPLNISAEVREILPLIHAAVPKIVEVALDLEESLPPVQADAAQMQQVIANLVINAGEASVHPGGKVKISTSSRFLEEPQEVSYGTEMLGAGEYVLLRVDDNGHGIDEETRRRMFEPFFSTKFTGRGLGLAAVLGIVRAHRGAITVDSCPGEGSSFCVYFPAASTARPSEPPPAARAAP
jgi:PAS domain S-box-containing protein